jgi:uncharacterized membrane protein HdeD (DUF308 family)
MNIMSSLESHVEEARKNWGWLLALGIVLILVGAYCIWAEMAATLASMVVLGAVLVVAGIVRLVSIFTARSLGYGILLLLGGIFELIVGLILIEHPALGALTITLFVAMLLLVGGVFRFFSALWLRMPQYGWVAFSGIVSLVLGILLWAQWPFSALWFIGFAVGVSLIFDGAAWASLALRLKR